VDGLRALAVMPVVLFHAGFALFGGGYVGVDVFYVISGYLITGIIKSDVDDDRFSLVHFYERRVRRIIPALMLVIFACLVAGIALFLPFQLAKLGISAINAITFTSNVWFWSQAGYFNGLGLEPLLHTWSLAVEEQFYLFFPIGIWLLTRLRVPLRPVVVAVFLASLVGAEFLVHRMPSVTFYMLPTRAWELMLGAMLALGLAPRIARRQLRDGAAAVGVALILLPVFLYDADTVFPGLSALPPCLGAALVILAGREGGGGVTRLIGSRVPVAIGLISYSLYLWHWPVFVFSRQILLTTQLPVAVALVGILLSFALAWITWRFVEAPFRSRARISRRRMFMTAAGLMAVVGATAAATTGGLPSRFAPAILRLADGKGDIPAPVRACIGTEASLSACHVGSDGRAAFAIWGDSHSAAIGGAVDLAARARSRSGVLYAFNGCPPAVGAPSPTLPPPDQSRCRARDRLVRDRLVADTRVRTVLLIAYWDNYLRLAPDTMLRSLTGTIAELRRAGKDVVIVAGVPAPGFDVPWAAAMSGYYGRPLPVSQARSGVDPRLAGLAARTGARLIDLSPSFCGFGGCRVVQNGQVLFIDGNHVSAYANRSVIAPFLLQRGLFSESGDRR
jgi:peptidoglycan/LPS O-acetylase OafA/YrhL